jgi:hypothetical protein
MDILKRILMTVFCFLAALGCYVIGIPVGGIGFLLLGLVFEGLFWFGLLGAKKK